MCCLFQPILRKGEPMDKYTSLLLNNVSIDLRRLSVDAPLITGAFVDNWIDHNFMFVPKGSHAIE